MSTRRILAASLCALVTALAPLATRASGPTDVAGVPASLVGINGPTQHVLSNLELVGHSDIGVPDATGTIKPLGNHGAPAFIDDCAYVGRWHDYRGRNLVQILDVSDPAAPTVVGGVPDTARNGGVAREIRAVDLPSFKMLAVLIFSSGLGDRVNNRMQLYTIPEGGSCRSPVLAGTFDMRAFRGHEFYLWIDPEGFDVEGRPRVLAYVTAPIGPPNIMVLDVSQPSAPTLAGLIDAGKPVVSPFEEKGTYLGTYAHSISLSPDGKEAYVSYWDGGFFTLDTSAFAIGIGGTAAPKGLKSHALTYPLGDFGNTHSAVRVPDTNTVVIGDEIYISTDGCPFGFLRTADLGSETQAPSLLGEFRLAENRPENCTTVPGVSAGSVVRAANVRNAAGQIVDGTFSMHNQTLLGSYVFASWYGGGLRVIDVSAPAAPSQAALFVPKPLEVEPMSLPQTSAPTYGVDGIAGNEWKVAMWSYPVIRDGLIYVTDVRNGLYVLRPAPGAPFASLVAGTRFAEGNSNLGSFLN